MSGTSPYTTITNADWGTTTTWTSASPGPWEYFTKSTGAGASYIASDEFALYWDIERSDQDTAFAKVIDYVFTRYRTPAP